MTFLKKLLDKQIVGEMDQKDFEELGQFEHATMHNKFAPMFWERAVDSEVFDYRGKRWIDFTSSIAVANSGHANESVCKAINRAVNDKVLTTFTFPNRHRLKLSKKLGEMFLATFGTEYRSHFLCSGSEAVECALDLALAYHNKERSVVISFFNAFHGNTAKSDLISGQQEISFIKQGNKEVFFIKVPYVSKKESGENGFEQKVCFRLDKRH